MSIYSILNKTSRIVAAMLLSTGLLAGQFAFLVPKTEALSLPAWMNATVGSANTDVKAARWLDAFFQCIYGVANSDASDNIDVLMYENITNEEAAALNITKNVGGGNSSDEVAVGHDLEYGNSIGISGDDAIAGCNELEVPTSQYLTATQKQDLINLLYTKKSDNSGYSLIHSDPSSSDFKSDIAAILNSPLVKGAREGDIRKARLAVALSYCFELNKEDLDSGTLNYLSGKSDDTEIRVGLGFTSGGVGYKCSYLKNTLVSSEGLIDFMKDLKVTGGVLRNNPQNIYAELETKLAGERKEEATEERKEQAAADILEKLSQNTPQVTKCIQDVGAPVIQLGNLTGSPISITDSTGKTTEIKTGDVVKQTGADALIRTIAWLESSPGNLYLERISEILTTPTDPLHATTMGDTEGMLLTSGSVTTPDNLEMDVMIPTENFLSLAGCITVNVPGIGDLLTEFRNDIEAIESAYNDVANSNQPTDSTAEEEIADDCLAQDDFLSWFVCPVINLIDSALETIESRIQEMLVFNLDTSGSKQGLQDSWNIFRSLATIIITVGFLLALVIKAIRGE